MTGIAETLEYLTKVIRMDGGDSRRHACRRLRERLAAQTRRCVLRSAEMLPLRSEIDADYLVLLSTKAERSARHTNRPNHYHSLIV
jgi:hypothetical protein